MNLTHTMVVAAALGFKAGDTVLPKHHTLVYREPRNAKGLFYGMLWHKPSDATHYSNSLFWTSLSSAKDPVIYQVYGQKVLKLTPITVDDSIGPNTLRRRMVTSWKAEPQLVLPKDVQEVIDVLGKSSNLTSRYTIDCLNKRVVDVHSGLIFTPMNWDVTFVVRTIWEADKNRPYYEHDVKDIEQRFDSVAVDVAKWRAAA